MDKSVSRVREVVDKESIVPRILIVEEEKLVLKVTVVVSLHQIALQVPLDNMTQFMDQKEGESLKPNTIFSL